LPNRIVLLDENTANRIAAGEVVERPASAVKELVENAIDAGATQIAIALTEGGKQRIEVADNGCGMSPEDAVLSLQRHATSKIRRSDDLFAIRTLGFRGEALPSIASVSHFTLTTRAESEPSGVQIIVRGGEIESMQEIGGRNGTVVVVEELFYNTPARLKFLKSTPTEIARVLEVVGHLAIAHPQIAFRVVEGRAERLSTPGSGDPLGALTAVWGRDIARYLRPIRLESPGLCVSGYICTPEVSRPGRSHELFCVNGRPIKSRLLSHALEDAFRTLTPDSRYPVAAVFLEIAPDRVDVNVHPTKSEVKFTRDGDVHHAVSQAVKTALMAYGLLPVIGEKASPLGAPPALRSLHSSSAYAQPTLPALRSLHSSSAYAQPTLPGRDFERLARIASDAFKPVESSSDPPPAAAGESDAVLLEKAADFAAEQSDPFQESVASDQCPFAEQLRGFRVLGQAQNTYIVAVTDQGIAFVDQHVAHERVLYERLTVKRLEMGIPSQRLVIPLTLSLGAAEASLLMQKLEDFSSAGWEIEPFGRETFLVRAVPALIRPQSCESLLRDMIDELAHLSVSRRLIVQRDHVTITNACKMAVKAGDPLTMEEMVGLLEQLAQTRNPYVCPHGRPIVVTLPYLELERKFKRT
jgi:DNA mismatch repair protein MutL